MFYEGGIPGNSMPMLKMVGMEDLCQPDCGCLMATPKKAELGSCDCSGQMSKDFMDQSSYQTGMDCRIETKSVVSNQPKN